MHSCFFPPLLFFPPLSLFDAFNKCHLDGTLRVSQPYISHAMSISLKFRLFSIYLVYLSTKCHDGFPPPGFITLMHQNKEKKLKPQKTQANFDRKKRFMLENSSHYLNFERKHRIFHELQTFSSHAGQFPWEQESMEFSRIWKLKSFAIMTTREKRATKPFRT